ncbi:unnamed protein product [Caenorhabditis auriculariae]|uniref:Uncharacterized protein n=1 Tax=Caenorhabditis auriculariae TaxID=2777116 RepID=A0A8S1GQZ9_9PELO|nr:unnamed protein product [Caenorhabditis auriculariae]
MNNLTTNLCCEDAAKLRDVGDGMVLERIHLGPLTMPLNRALLVFLCQPQRADSRIDALCVQLRSADENHWASLLNSRPLFAALKSVVRATSHYEVCCHS